MKNICLISGGLFPVPAVKGGAVEELISALLRYSKGEQSFRLHVLTTYDQDLIPLAKKDNRIHIIKNPKIISLSDRLLYYYWDSIKKDWRAMFNRKKLSGKFYSKAVMEHLKNHLYDAVIVENNMSLLPYVYAGMGEDDFQTKCLYHAHSVLVDNPASIPFLKSCSKIITVSDYVTTALSKAAELKDQTYVTLINGVDTKQFNPDAGRKNREQLRKNFHIAENDFTFLYAGRISVEKGVKELVDAFVSLHIENAVLVIAGGSFSGEGVMGQYEKELRKKCENEHLRVCFTGYISHSEMHKMYGMADCLIIPSVVEEAGPLTALEGAVMGIPLIAPDKGAIKEYLENYPYYYEMDKQKTQLPRLMKLVCEHSSESVCMSYRKDYFSTEAYYQRFLTVLQEYL